MSRRPFNSIVARLLGLAICALAVLTAGTATAGAAPPKEPGAWWLMKSTAAPVHVKPGGRTVIYSQATNIGYQPVSSEGTNKIVIKETIPAGFKVKTFLAEGGPSRAPEHFETLYPKCVQAERVYTCTLEHGVIAVAEDLRVRIDGTLEPSATLGTTLTNELSISGGETPEKEEPHANQISSNIEVTEAPVPFDTERFELRPENNDGSIDTQAGSHPFQLTTVFDLAKIGKEQATFGFQNMLPFLPALPRTSTSSFRRAWWAPSRKRRPATKRTSRR